MAKTVKPTPYNNKMYREIAEFIFERLSSDAHSCGHEEAIKATGYPGVDISWGPIETYLLRRKGQHIVKVTRTFLRRYEARWPEEWKLPPDEKYLAASRYLAGFPPKCWPTAGYIVWCMKYIDLLEVYLYGKALWEEGCQEYVVEQRLLHADLRLKLSSKDEDV